ncbi:hypothetical protein BH10PSE9_BH10PSE9_10710 [soil metagenome]
MRGLARLVRTANTFTVAFFVALAAMLAAPAADAADKRVIVTQNADYTGFDLRTVKNVDLPGCQTACLADTTCKAFTFNVKAGWCFLKSDFGVLASTQGATAGRVVASADLTPSLERQRIAELNFLQQDLLDEARAQIGSLKSRFTTTGSFGALRTSGGTAFRGGQYDQAAHDFGAALVIANDEVNSWLDFAQASIRRSPSNSSDKDRANIDATAASINAYLHAETKPDRAEALALLGQSLGKRTNWKQAIRAYRASLAQVEVASVRSTYDDVVSKYGFRVISHDVQADSAVPQICVKFSDSIAVTKPGLTDYVTVEGGAGLAVEPQQQQICINGVKHGGRYTIRLRNGLPAADGETLLRPVQLEVYVRDREPWVGFAGNAYVLPAGPGATIPINSVNTEKAKAKIYRIPDRGIAGSLRDGEFMSGLSTYSADQIADQSGEKVWEGEISIQTKLNENVVTAIPVGEALKTMKPGAYVITAAPQTSKTDEDGSVATQWFIVSDLGLTALSGHDGVHAIVRSLSTAKPIAGVKLRLVAVNNEVLGEATSDDAGYARFDPGLARGTGGMAPQLISAETGSDYGLLDLSRAAFDLTDRGVGGRPAPAQLDAFLTPERGIYRPGEVVHLTGLVRDSRAVAVRDLPITLIVERPDGVEFLRRTLSDGGAGGYSSDVTLQANAMRGSWRVKMFTDPKAAPIAEASVLVEDFEPERLAVEIDTKATAFSTEEPPVIDLSARYLYGAPATELAIEGEIGIKAVDTLPAFPGYKFGLTEEATDSTRQPLDIAEYTDDEGKASFEAALPELMKTTKPLSAEMIIRVADTNGRSVERRLARPVKPEVPAIGIKPLFDGDVEENANARFEAILVSPDGKRIAAADATWKLERIESDYQWYRNNGSWNYELITNAQRVGGGKVEFKADGAPAALQAQVNWGRYRLTVQREGDAIAAATSVEFYAGWYRAVSSSATPDTLQVALDKPDYKIGETAKLRIDARFPGIALVSVIDDRVISMKSVEVPEGGSTVDLEVTDKWGPGAYVSATLYRPMDIAAKRMPARALGLTWAKVAPGDRKLNVAVTLPDETRPRSALAIPVSITNLKPGDEARVTIAAVDVGILNLTNFKAPAPDDR